jgi:hypothetical protein
MAALALDDTEVADLRRGVGADAIDELAQCFEIKVSSSAEILDRSRSPRLRSRARGQTTTSSSVWSLVSVSRTVLASCTSGLSSIR